MLKKNKKNNGNMKQYFKIFKGNLPPKNELHFYRQTRKLIENMEGGCQALFLAGKQTWLTESLAAVIAGSAGCCR